MNMKLWHQLCIQVLPGGKKINGDVKPFTKAESYFADARFFEEEAILKKTVPAVISSTGKRGSSGNEDMHAVSNGRTKDKVKQQQQCGKESSQVTMLFFLKQAIVETSPVAPVFMYIPRSHRKDSELPLNKCAALKAQLGL